MASRFVRFCLIPLSFRPTPTPTGCVAISLLARRHVCAFPTIDEHTLARSSPNLISTAIEPLGHVSRDRCNFTLVCVWLIATYVPPFLPFVAQTSPSSSSPGFRVVARDGTSSVLLIKFHSRPAPRHSRVMRPNCILQAGPFPLHLPSRADFCSICRRMPRFLRVAFRSRFFPLGGLSREIRAEITVNSRVASRF